MNPLNAHSGNTQRVISLLIVMKLSEFLEHSQVATIIKYGECHECEQEIHADSLCDFKESVGGLATRDDFVEQEENMTTIESRDGKDVHKCEHE